MLHEIIFSQYNITNKHYAFFSKEMVVVQKKREIVFICGNFDNVQRIFTKDAEYKYKRLKTLID